MSDLAYSWGQVCCARRQIRPPRCANSRGRGQSLLGGPTVPKATSLRPYVNDRALRRFWSRVDTSGDCWLWTGLTPASGYGIFAIGHKRTGVHRFAYELTNGPIPEGLVLDHLCRTPRCVRPDHLDPVTQAENLRRGMSPTAIAVRAGLCHNGHDLDDPSNVLVGVKGERNCIPCIKARRLVRYAAWKQANGVGDMKPKGTCSLEGCDGAHNSKGLCRHHYDLARRRGL